MPEPKATMVAARGRAVAHGRGGDSHSTSGDTIAPSPGAFGACADDRITGKKGPAALNLATDIGILNFAFSADRKGNPPTNRAATARTKPFGKQIGHEIRSSFRVVREM
jgi:hypothetical protein